MIGEKLAGVGVAASWSLWGYVKLAQVNELLTSISLIAATFASIAAGIYYLSKRK